jgi:HPt (histidine-containing phosphotransfer) domain-containing protein
MRNLNSTLKELEDLFGEEGLKEVLLAYQASLQEFEVFLTNEATDALTVKKQTHKMKSPSLSVGETKLADFCQRIERTGQFGASEKAEGLRLTAETRSHITTYLTS